MKDYEFDDELDLDMDRRLAGFARSSREPALPNRVADLPWTVQQEVPKSGFMEVLSGAAEGGPVSGTRLSGPPVWQ